MGIKKIVIAGLILAGSVCLSAQNKTILITESHLPYKSQTWFYSGNGQDLDESKIKSYWDQGKRITSVAYTTNGWFVTMANSSGITMQTYKLSQIWPKDWIKEKWVQDYYITSIARSNKEWLVVMSKGTEFTDQYWSRNTWDNLSSWIREKREQGMSITEMAFDGTYWTVVVSKTSKISTQGYLFADDSNVVSMIRSEVYDMGYNLHLMDYGDGQFVVVYGNYSENDDRKQSYSINPSDAGSFIQEKWDKSHDIAYIGGGFSETSSQSLASNTNSTTSNVSGSPSKNQIDLPAKYLVSHNGMYGQERIGTFYYLDDGGTSGHARIHTLKFEKINGKYYIRFPAATYALKEITSTEFVFENDIRIGPDPYWSYYLAGTITEEMKEKRNNQFRIRVSKDWNRIVMNGDTMLIGEVTKEYYDAALAINQKAYKQAMQVNSMLQSQSYSSEVSDQLKADIEESERKLDQMNAKQNDLYKKRDDMNRGHTIIRYKSTNVPSTPSVWCSICNRYDKPHDHVLNDGRH